MKQESKIRKVLYCTEHETPIGRICSDCHKQFFKGYCIEQEDYYCSAKCLEKNMSKEEFLKLYNKGNGSSYYTEWEKICEECD